MSPSTQGDADETARSMLAELRSQGAHAKDAVSQVVDATGLPRRQVYRMWLDTAGDQP